MRGDPLSLAAMRLRLFAVGALLVAGTVLHFADPAHVANTWIFPTSCGAITGLPCVFCGVTRALHHLLNGDIARALYFNWLAIPLALATAVFAVTAAMELVWRRRLLRLPPPIRITPRVICWALTSVVVLWSLQVYLAVSSHKTELLNPSGPLYRFVVK